MIYPEGGAAAADFDLMPASSPSHFAGMMRQKASGTFAAHSHALDAPGRIGMFVGMMGFGDPSVLVRIAVEEQPKALRENYPDGAAFASTAAQAQ